MIYFGTLLWIDEKNHSAINNKNKSVLSYFRQIDLLAKMLRAEFDCALTVFTNTPAPIRSWFSDKGHETPNIVPITSTMPIPSGTRFYAAHHKLDALIAGLDLLKTDEDRFFLLDADIIVRRCFDSEQMNMVQSADLIVYNISDQVFPAYGATRIKADIENVANTSFADAKWFGGEMIGGNRKGLQHLIEKANSVLPRYFDRLPSLHHVGDEMFISASLNLLLKDEPTLKIIEQNPYRLISRHWARHTDRSFQHHMQSTFVHCPDSKPALELLSLSQHPQQNLVFSILKLYQFAVRSYQFGKNLLRRIRPVQ